MAATKLKLGLASLLTAGVATTLVLQHQTNDKLRNELAALRAQAAEAQPTSDLFELVSAPKMPDFARYTSKLAHYSTTTLSLHLC